ncbi:hypothetical protein [Methylobacterium nodulans]|uniref:Uncharacterized protein n=1 Tax=Methylobacterium nodulans (strain LMG 21967 / CNCM I-2342 / ORS 2060) TaxID=460265 RepID=B8IE53_METNO|nr:hypothetical protein [Methylobacterium nodulans]ACL57599.1 hypothetical protein Mnod_2636 [Methylobacterium nodulans ORS 2060]
MLTSDRPTAPVVDLRTGRIFDPLHVAAMASFEMQRRAAAIARRADLATERLGALVLVGRHLVALSRVIDRTDIEGRIAADIEIRAALQVISAQIAAAQAGRA